MGEAATASATEVVGTSAAKRGPYAKSARRRREIIDEVLTV
jgi:hypothetical protein